jgi:hypothetical protein
LFFIEMLRNNDRHPNPKMTTTAAIQMSDTATLGDELMTMLRSSGDNEIKITIKSF